jgi:hypothetical protein
MVIASSGGFRGFVGSFLSFGMGLLKKANKIF